MNTHTHTRARTHTHTHTHTRTYTCIFDLQTKVISSNLAQYISFILSVIKTKEFMVGVNQTFSAYSFNAVIPGIKVSSHTASAYAVMTNQWLLYWITTYNPTEFALVGSNPTLHLTRSSLLYIQVDISILCIWRYITVYNSTQTTCNYYTLHGLLLTGPSWSFSGSVASRSPMTTVSLVTKCKTQ